MDRKIVEKIKKQLSLRENKLFCMHNNKTVCEKCKKNIRGDVTGITGDVTDITGDVSGITGNVSGIRGNVTDIKKILEKKEAVK